LLENLVYLAVPQNVAFNICGDNPTSAENQQERLINVMRILRGHTPNIPVRGMKIWSQLHGDMQGR
jgi:hypothetical protein